MNGFHLISIELIKMESDFSLFKVPLGGFRGLYGAFFSTAGTPFSIHSGIGFPFK